MGNAFVHVELNTDNLSAAKDFYAEVFDWKLSDVPGMPYTMIDVGRGTAGGMQPKPMPNAPTAWLPYVEVKSVKDSIAKARAAGAQVMVDYMPIGEEMGAIGVFVDPTGAALGVWEAAKKAPARKPAAKKATKKPAKKAAKKGSKRR